MLDIELLTPSGLGMIKDYLVGRGSFLKVTPKPLSTCLMQLVVKVVK
jgi:hypothetical protein